MKTKEWAALTHANTLLVGESSTLQWSDQVIDYVMFLDCFFRDKPYDLGERSRYTEAKNTFDMVRDITGGRCRPENLYAANLTYDLLEPVPRGKRHLITPEQAKVGVAALEKILADNPTITQVFVMGMQANYYLQKFGFCNADEEYLKGACARTNAAEQNFYQPIDGKAFRKICCKKFITKCNNLPLFPILYAKEYPLRGENERIFGELYENLKK